ncbi:GntR family transcriptional regulator [Agromyces aerolatus]|uniref:GntR family transcriptional regulator n=1 Tax=Agromyces sp. LY-1074 TaxID=3074080 RepID=UPI00285685E9|nr:MULTISPECIES: GntR family transcriptional regulator [unclassified Agromyces]MDR5701386.1 GntR family transcriptional regulator [Agromyces sp. LY-1074]MDR5706825.1 GntR family transcriptional regulator [Agromyces sp. LY-1358]
MVAGADVDRRVLRDQVYDRLLEMLLQGGLRPGDRLSIDLLARQLDVSPTPVREAMVHLERTGLVAREALKGYRVAPPLDHDQLAELFDARVLLEVGAARSAAVDAERTAADLWVAHERHRVVVERIVAVRGEIPLELTREFFRADEAFHAVVFAHARNRYLVELYDQLGALTHRMRQVVVRGPVDVADAFAEHAAIVEAFATGDGEAAAVAMREHLGRARARALADSDAALGERAES